MKIILQLLALFTLLGCNQCVRLITVKNGFHWYGPANAAFDDYIYYYRELPPSLDSLASFVEIRSEELDDDRYCFGNADFICGDMRRRGYAYAHMEDSCFYYGKRYKGHRESCIKHSVSYCFGHPEEFAKYFTGDLYDWKQPAFYSASGRRCCEKQSVLFNQGIRDLSAGYSRYVIKGINNNRSYFYCYFLFEFADGNLTMLDVFPNDMNFTIRSLLDGTTEIIQTDNELVSTCNDWIDCLNVFMLHYIRDYPEINRIIFPAPLMVIQPE